MKLLLWRSEQISDCHWIPLICIHLTDSHTDLWFPLVELYPRKLSHSVKAIHNVLVNIDSKHVMQKLRALSLSYIHLKLRIWQHVFVMVNVRKQICYPWLGLTILHDRIYKNLALKLYEQKNKFMLFHCTSIFLWDSSFCNWVFLSWRLSNFSSLILYYRHRRWIYAKQNKLSVTSNNSGSDSKSASTSSELYSDQKISSFDPFLCTKNFLPKEVIVSVLFNPR